MSDRVVYDCMLFLQQALRPQRTHATFKEAISGRVTLCVSAEILAEIRDVLTRPEIRAKAPALTGDSVDAFLRGVAKYAALIADVPDVYTLQRDPKDSKYINLALAAGANRIVTWDQHLLGLMDPTCEDGRDFQTRFAGIRIVRPPEFLAELRSG